MDALVSQRRLTFSLLYYLDAQISGCRFLTSHIKYSGCSRASYSVLFHLYVWMWFFFIRFFIFFFFCVFGKCKFCSVLLRRDANITIPIYLYFIIYMYINVYAIFRCWCEFIQWKYLIANAAKMLLLFILLTIGYIHSHQIYSI